jgi:hypothetical protein
MWLRARPRRRDSRTAGAVLPRGQCYGAAGAVKNPADFVTFRLGPKSARSGQPRKLHCHRSGTCKKRLRAWRPVPVQGLVFGEGMTSPLARPVTARLSPAGPPDIPAGTPRVGHLAAAGQLDVTNKIRRRSSGSRRNRRESPASTAENLYAVRRYAPTVHAPDSAVGRPYRGLDRGPAQPGARPCHPSPPPVRGTGWLPGRRTGARTARPGRGRR